MRGCLVSVLMGDERDAQAVSLITCAQRKLAFICLASLQDSAHRNRRLIKNSAAKVVQQFKKTDA